VIGVVPAAGCGQRIQPLGCSKELLPVGWRIVKGHRRPKAVIEYLLDRMIAAGTDRICFIISPEKSDIIRYLSDCDCPAEIFYLIQPQPHGLCDAIFRAASFARDHEEVLIGLPDTIWFPMQGFSQVLQQNRSDVNLLLFPTETPSAFDAVVCNPNHKVQRVEVKQPDATSRWVWGAVTSSAERFRDLKDLWEARGRVERLYCEWQGGEWLSVWGDLPRCRHSRWLSSRAGFPAASHGRASRIRPSFEFCLTVRAQDVANFPIDACRVLGRLIDQLQPLLVVLIQLALGQQIRRLHHRFNGVAEIMSEAAQLQNGFAGKFFLMIHRGLGHLFLPPAVLTKSGKGLQFGRSNSSFRCARSRNVTIVST
jgi:glucose-1-phosphate thymidylyltransferase